jgi:hypothetical protein
MDSVAPPTTSLHLVHGDQVYGKINVKYIVIIHNAMCIITMDSLVM